ncbi:unnamed protein product [Coregonus sp. 'balchen']|nr:unnamed protein product [Coregonus sp. 'balchen']
MKKRHGAQHFWKSMTGQQPQSEPDRTGGGDTMVTDTNITATFDNLSQNVVPIPIRSIPPLGQSDSHMSVSYEDKTGATVMFSGIFLAMGWLKYGVSRSFKWTQLLGPILLSVGGTFILISICKFRMLSCRACKQSDYDEELSESLEIPGSGQLFVFNGINQPIMFHGATVVQYILAPCGSVTQEGNPANGFQPNSGSANGVPRNVPPQYYTVCLLGNVYRRQQQPSKQQVRLQTRPQT